MIEQSNDQLLRFDNKTGRAKKKRIRSRTYSKIIFKLRLGSLEHHRFTWLSKLSYGSETVGPMVNLNISQILG